MKINLRMLNPPATLYGLYWIYLLTILSLTLLFSLHFYYFSPFFFPLDDAYIFLHNAQVLLLGHDINYPGTPALSGTTSPVFLFLLFPLTKWFAPTNVLESVLWLAIFCYATGIIRLASLYRASVLQILLLLLTSLTIGSMTFHLLNGVETGLAVAAFVWALVLASLPMTRLTRVLAPLFWGTLPFIRPELAILSGLLFLYQGYRYWDEQPSFTTVLGKLSQDAFWLMLGALPWLIWLWETTGLLYPNTIMAKKAFFAGSLAPFDSLMAILSLIEWMMNVPLILIMLLLLASPLGRILLLFLWIFILIFAFSKQCYVLLHNLLRYPHLLIPLMCYSLLSTCQSKNRYIYWTANILIVYACWQAVHQLDDKWHQYRNILQTYQTELPSYTNWCKEHIPSNATIIIQDAGYLAFVSNFRLIDFVGLKTPENIQYHKQYTLPSNGALRVPAISLIMKKHPAQYLIVTSDWNSSFNMIGGLQQLGWRLQLLRIPDNNQAGYLIYAITNKVYSGR